MIVSGKWFSHLNIGCGGHGLGFWTHQKTFFISSRCGFCFDLIVWHTNMGKIDNTNNIHVALNCQFPKTFDWWLLISRTYNIQNTKTFIYLRRLDCTFSSLENDLMFVCGFRLILIRWWLDICPTIRSKCMIRVGFLLHSEGLLS